MRSRVVYNHPEGEPIPGDSGRGGGHVEDILKRLGNVETDVSEVKSKVSAILATVPHLATKADVMDVRSAVAELRAEMSSETGSIRNDMSVGFGALRAEMAAGFGALKAEMTSEIGSVRNDMAAGLGALRAEMTSEIGSVRSEIGTLRNDMSVGFGELRTEMAARETAFIKWMIATVMTASGLAFTIAKFVH